MVRLLVAPKPIWTRSRWFDVAAFGLAHEQQAASDPAPVIGLWRNTDNRCVAAFDE